MPVVGVVPCVLFPALGVIDQPAQCVDWQHISSRLKRQSPRVGKKLKGVARVAVRPHCAPSGGGVLLSQGVWFIKGFTPGASPPLCPADGPKVLMDCPIPGSTGHRISGFWQKVKKMRLNLLRELSLTALRSSLLYWEEETHRLNKED